MAFRLVYRLEDRIQRRLLSRGENVVGAKSGCDIVIDHASVSRHHATLLVTSNAADAGANEAADMLTVADLNSRNGTRLDDHRLRGNVEVRAGQRLTFGSIETTVEEVLEDDAVPAITSPPKRHSPLENDPTNTTAESKPADRRTTAAPLTAHTTASVGPLSVFVLGYLPSLTSELAAGTTATRLAQRAGAALLEALPCRSVSIERDHGRHTTQLFEGQKDRPGDVTATAISNEIKVTAYLSNSDNQALLEPLLATVADLICAADQHTRTSSKKNRSRSARTGAQPPDPLSVESNVKDLYDRALKVAPSDVNVLILGESGTGKELLARFIHAASDRCAGPFVAMNCAALPQDLQESELFGIERGVATGVDARAGLFEQAHGGTLFLDEIGDMELGVQAKILRVLQQQQVLRLGANSSRPADVRVLSATHRDVRAMLKNETFRTDLFHRIADFEATLPALRQRPGDIANLAVYFLDQAVCDRDSKPLGFSKGALAALRNFHWPGNIRQLEREVLKAALFVEDGELLDTTCLSPDVAAALSAESPLALKTQIEEAERLAIQAALDRQEGQVPAAAADLEVPSSTLYRKIKTLGLNA